MARDCWMVVLLISFCSFSLLFLSLSFALGIGERCRRARLNDDELTDAYLRLLDLSNHYSATRQTDLDTFFPSKNNSRSSISIGVQEETHTRRGVGACCSTTSSFFLTVIKYLTSYIPKCLVLVGTHTI